MGWPSSTYWETSLEFKWSWYKWWKQSTQDIFGDSIRGGYGVEEDDEWVTVPVNLIPGKMAGWNDKGKAKFILIRLTGEDDVHLFAIDVCYFLLKWA